jgi:hypothetical protein
MKMLAPRRAVRALLALMVLLAPLSAWTAAVPAGGGTRAERAIVHTMSRGEQVVLADRQPLLRAVVDRRGDLGRSRSVLLGILVGAALLGVTWRWRGRGGWAIPVGRRYAAPAYASRAPPRLETA